MKLKNTIIAAATLITTAVPSLALADGFHVSAGVDLPPVSVQVHTAGCHHDATPVQTVDYGYQQQPPPETQQQPGHYELRTVNEFVPGRYDQVWVPGSCVMERHGRWGRHVRQICNAGYYTQQWVPGRYVETTKYVFVADPVYYGGGYGAQR